MKSGDFVIVRTYSAGVHYGTLVSREGKVVVLRDARRLWYWVGAFTLNAVATDGVKKGSKIPAAVTEIVLTEAIEIFSVSEKAQKNLVEFPVHDE